MAQRVQVLLIDDIDGGEGAETITFGLDGVTYEIDLSAKNAAALRDSFATWVANGRKVSGRSTAGSARRGRPSRSGKDTAAIRSWAQENGYEVSARGRISRTVMEAYAAAH